MTEFKKVTDRISVAPQIDRSDIDRAAEMGIGLIINNRPDGEEAFQPKDAELADYARQKGINWVSIPIVSGQFTFEAIEVMSRALADTEAPVLAFCRTGTRSCNLWGLAEAFSKGLPTADILKCAASAGYNLSGLASTLDELRQIET